MKARKGPLLALTSALMAATASARASAWENPLENPYLDEPLDVCDQGSFFVGGVPKVTKYAAGPAAGDPQQITIGQAYVQFKVPKPRRQWPIVFVHGSTHTGAALDSTPDGKEGWHSYAVRRNLASFVMDPPGAWAFGFRPVRAPRGQGDPQLGHGADLRTGHRQRGVDPVVRPYHSRLDHH